ncbi:response regulator [candidate division KSB1 bacterium]|nr:response regulator [candidate division KSB1 bacterium]
MNTNGEKILVVDDEEIIRIGCQRILEEYDCSVQLAENGRIGLEKLKSERFDLVLIDLMMPELGGLELLEEICKIDRNIVSIIITGFATIETAVEAIKKGAYDYLSKPFTPDEFRAKVGRGLEKRHLLLEAERLRKEAAKNLIECTKQKSRTQTIINSMAEGVIATSLDGTIGLVNPSAIKLLRIKNEKIVGNRIEGLLGIPELEGKIKSISKTFVPATFQFSTAENRFLQANITPIVSEESSVGTVTVLSDITEEKKIEEAKSNFVSLVSHELKAPLGAIEGYLTLILDGLTAGNAEKEHDIIQKSRDRAAELLDLINDLLDLSRTDRKKSLKAIKKIDMAQLLRDVCDFYQNEAKEKSILLDLTVADQLPAVQGSEEDLARLFSNLISNAIKYTPKGGVVNINADKKRSLLAVFVKDTGIGISKDEVGKIFDQFFRASSAVQQKIGGTGLGLSIARKIAEDHNGYIEVDSELGKGTTFTVYLTTTEDR